MYSFQWNFFLDDEDNSSSSLNPVIVSVIVIVVALFMNFSEIASQMWMSSLSEI